jgi:DNA (cytosine-5)-methyltransferase 1
VLASSTTKIGTGRRGSPRVWLEGRRLERSGFVPSARYEISFDDTGRTVTLRLAANGDRMVSRRSRGDVEQPVVDIENSRILGGFDGLETLRVRFEEGAVVITPTASDLRRLERSARMRSRLSQGKPLLTGSVSTGLGVLSLAIHQGLADAGIPSTMAFSIEIDERYQEHCASANPAWSPSCIAIASPMQEVAYDVATLAALPQVDVLEAGIPCTAHSSAGRAKKGLAKPEDDEKAGHLVAAFLAIVAASNPGVLLVENVPAYMDSASFSILRNQLVEWGYDVRSTTLKGEEFGCLEHRDRMALVATTMGVDVDLETLAPATVATPRLSDVLDDVPLDSPLWSSMTYLKEKEVRDREAGKNFAMQIFEGDATSVSTIGRGYAKIRSTEPKIRHPEDHDLLRQLTPAEHARIKGIPEGMVLGVPQGLAHEMLGQSVLAAPFRALGARIGGALSAWLDDRPAPRGERRAPAVAPLSDLPLFA